MSLLVIGILCLAIVQLSFCDGEMPGLQDPIAEFLQLDSGSQHELVDIEFVDRLHKRDYSEISMPAGKRIKIRAFGSDVDLWLHPKDSILVTENTPVYFSTYDPRRPGRVNIQLQPGLMRHVGEILEDPAFLASFVIGKDQHGRTTFNGRIGSLNLGVRSLPAKVVDDYVELRRAAGDSEDDIPLSSYHVVYRIQGDFEDNPFSELDGVSLRRDHPSSGVPDVIYPKLLLVVDYSLFHTQQNNVYAYLQYLVAFANGIDLKYRSLESPSFRFYIGGIIISLEPRGLPYIANEMVSYRAFDSLKAITEAKRFFYRIRYSVPLQTYDLTATLTKFSFGLNEDHVLGKSWVGVTCRNSSIYEAVQAAAICRDDNSFLGVHVAAHELGHSFGLHHDLQASDDCQYHNGFIMAFAPYYTTNSSSFSSCSLVEFQREINNRNYECMYEAPSRRNKNLPKLMPGRVKSLREQCASFGLGPPCNTTDLDICVNAKCLDDGHRCYRSGTAALEGTPCGDPNDLFQKSCVHNRCVRV